jgi:hypothetical protein
MVHEDTRMSTRRSLITTAVILGFTAIAPSVHAAKLLRANDYGDKWPFTVAEGEVSCRAGSAVVFEVNGKAYAVNGNAKSRGYLPIEPIWRHDPGMIKMQEEIAKAEGKTLEEIKKLMGPMPRVNISPIIDAGLALC